jgi:hypothetical protein
MKKNTERETALATFQNACKELVVTYLDEDSWRDEPQYGRLIGLTGMFLKLAATATVGDLDNYTDRVCQMLESQWESEDVLLSLENRIERHGSEHIEYVDVTEYLSDSGRKYGQHLGFVDEFGREFESSGELTTYTCPIEPACLPEDWEEARYDLEWFTIETYITEDFRIRALVVSR